MSSNINRVIISGNLTRDPELRSTGSGTSVLTFGVAVNDSRRNQTTGEWEDHPNFIDCVSFAARAEGLSKVLRKGMKVCVEGKLRWNQWETADGQKRSKIEVVVDSIEFMSSRNGGGYNGSSNGFNAPANAPATHAEPAIPQVATTGDIYDEDIPF